MRPDNVAWLAFQPTRFTFNQSVARHFRSLSYGGLLLHELFAGQHRFVAETDGRRSCWVVLVTGPEKHGEGYFLDHKQETGFI